MRTFRRFALSRKTSLVLILLILGVVLLSYMIPQRITTTKAEFGRWTLANPVLAEWVVYSGLDHVYTTIWFAILLLIFLSVLCFSLYEQTRLSFKKTFGQGVMPEDNWLRTGPAQSDVRKTLRKSGFFQVYRGDSYSRFIKHPGGYWGNVLLHLGIVLVIASSLVLVLTQKRGVLQLFEGEVHDSAKGWVYEEHGLFSERFKLPYAVRIDRVIAEYWETDDLKQLTTLISIIGGGNAVEHHSVAINRVLQNRGLRIYQGKDYGDAFFVELYRKGRIKDSIVLQLSKPDRRDMPSYDNFSFEGLPYLLKAKYFADAKKQAMDSSNPLLVMRLVDGSRIAGEVSLKVGESGKLGPFTAKLAYANRWAEVIFVDIHAMPGIFLGFFLIIMGGGLTYFFPPREIYMKTDNGGYFIKWKAAKFGEFYTEEYERIMKSIGLS